MHRHFTNGKQAFQRAWKLRGAQRLKRPTFRARPRPSGWRHHFFSSFSQPFFTFGPETWPVCGSLRRTSGARRFIRAPQNSMKGHYGVGLAKGAVGGKNTGRARVIYCFAFFLCSRSLLAACRPYARKRVSLPNNKFH